MDIVKEITEFLSKPIGSYYHMDVWPNTMIGEGSQFCRRETNNSDNRFVAVKRNTIVDEVVFRHVPDDAERSTVEISFTMITNILQSESPIEIKPSGHKKQ